MPETVTLTIDGIAVTVPKGTLLVEAAKHAATEVPVYCYHPKLGPAGLCRICLVDVEKTPKLQIACNTVATDGMVVHTRGAKVEDGRRAVLEFLLLNHPLDCPICDKGGECDLQDYSMAYGRGASRLADPKLVKPKAVDLGPTIVLDDERCIVCQRCTRFDDIITHERSIVVKDRGHHDVIATATDEPYVSSFSGNVTELCPVGALTSKTYRFKSRPWDLHRATTTCTQCSVGCRMHVDERHGNVLRTMSVPDDDAHSDGWLCDRGRYNVGYLDSPERLVSPMLRVAGEFTQISWDDAIALWAAKLKEARLGQSASAIGVIGGGRLLNEEAYLLAHVFREYGVENLDWRAGRQRQLVPADLVGTYADLEHAQTIVVLGVPPAQSAPVLDLRIRKAVMQFGARLIVVGPHGSGSFVPEMRAAGVGEIPDEALGAERIAIVGDGIAHEALRSLLERLAPRRASGMRLSVFVPGEQANARGAEAMGMVPRGGLDTRGMLEAARDGKLAMLSLFGVDLATRFPKGDLVAEALAATPFIVVSDLFPTETARVAHLILPAASAFEKDGHTTTMTGEVLPVRAGVARPDGVLGDGEMLVALADALGVAVPAPEAIARIASVRSPAPASPVRRDPRMRGDREPELARRSDALHLEIAEHPFGGGGTARFDARIAELRPVPTATLSPATAQARGLADGDRIDLTAAKGRTLPDLVVRVDPRAADGTVTIVGGLPEAPSNLLGDGTAVEIGAVRPARSLEAVR